MVTELKALSTGTIIIHDISNAIKEFLKLFEYEKCGLVKGKLVIFIILYNYIFFIKLYSYLLYEYPNLW